MSITGVWGYAQNRFGFDLVKNHRLPVRETIRPDKKTVEKYMMFVDSALKTDQSARKKGDRKLALKTDSVNAMAYGSLIDQAGYLTSDINQYWLPLYGMETKPDCKLKENEEKQMVLMNIGNKRFTLHLHLCDRFGMYLLQKMESSMTADQKGFGNEDDLTDYLITYLFRHTEFKLFSFYRYFYFSIILIPDLKRDEYRRYYEMAVAGYLEYAGEKEEDKFGYLIIDDVYYSAQGHYEWKEAKARSLYCKDVTSLVFRKNPSVRVVAEKFLTAGNRMIKKGRYYSLIVCKHQGVKMPYYGD